MSLSARSIGVRTGQRPVVADELVAVGTTVVGGTTVAGDTTVVSTSGTTVVGGTSTSQVLTIR